MILWETNYYFIMCLYLTSGTLIFAGGHDNTDHAAGDPPFAVYSMYVVPCLQFVLQRRQPNRPLQEINIHMPYTRKDDVAVVLYAFHFDVVRIG